ncbi:hypothetical protein ACHAXH_003339, partial [Discostella pseudostelligera]
MPARRPISLPRLAVAATAFSSSLRCRGSGGSGVSGFFVASSINNNIFLGAGGRRRAPTFISTTPTGHRPLFTNNRSLFRSMASRNMPTDGGVDMQSSSLPPTTWSDLLTPCTTQHNQQPWTTYAQHLFPPLSSTSHKGSHGRIAILGGSEKYTGAPFYAAQSALHCGVDLVSIYCAREACLPIKCYSPELMVQGVYSIEQLDVLFKEGEGIMNELEKCKQQNQQSTTNNAMNEVEIQQTMKKLEYSEDIIHNELRQKNDRIEILSERLAKIQSLEENLSHWKIKETEQIANIVTTITSNFITLHTLCIGPGLGRHPLVFSVVEQVLYKAMECQLMLVLDADVLYMLSLNENRVLLGELMIYERCVMTPNVMEMRRLQEAFSSLGIESNDNVLVQKGHVDTISCKTHTIMQCKEEGGLKRSGGIGDVLAGAISAFMAWNVIIEKDDCGIATDANTADGINANDERQQQQRVFAVWTAATLVKKATKLAYEKKRRSMSAINVIEEIGNVLDGMEEG